MFDLIPSAASSITVEVSGNAINTRNMFLHNKIQVIDLGFKNKGKNSYAIISFDGGEIVLTSGPLGAGEAWSPFIPSGFYDSGNYNVKFVPIDGAAESIHNLFVGYRKKLSHP